MKKIVRYSNFSDPNNFTNGLREYPANIPATDPPAPKILNNRLACRASNTSPASIQNCNIERETITSINTNKNGTFLFNINEATAADSSGEVLKATGKPAQDGDYMIKSSQDGLTNDEKSFHKVMAIMYPIRNALMYDIADLNQSKWDELITELQKRGIKETTFTNGNTPKDNYYGRQGVFDLAKSPGGKDIHHDVMKFLEESGLYLLCHVTSDDFNQTLKDNHPEGHDACGNAGIETKIPF